MKVKRGRKNVFWAVAIGILLMGAMALAAGEAANYMKGLHKTGGGMKYWYEQADGLKSITGMAYEDLPCKTCHADTCKKCHVKSMKAEDTRDINTCLGCHEKEAETFKEDEAAGSLDVHRKAGKICNDCHKGADHDDIHGNGVAVKSLFDDGAIKTRCENCHPADKMPDIPSHKVHAGKLDCPACHTRSTAACNNCHLDSFIADKKEEGNYMFSKSWTLLVNKNGKVTTGNAMTVVTKGKTFVVYGPYYTHSVQKQSKACGECHGNEAMKLVKAGQKIPMNKFEGGKTVNWQGTVPFAKDSIEWTFYDKKDGGWVPLEGAAAPAMQIIGGVTPLSDAQIKALEEPVEQK